MTVLIVAASAALFMCGQQAPAQTAAQAETPARDRAVISVVVENDVFAGTDRNYTNGTRFEIVRPAEETNPWLRRAARAQPFVDLDGVELRDGFALSHTLYTAQDITDPDPPADSHPYAAHLSFQWFATAADENSENTVLIDLGLIGPAAGGEFVQSNWHALIDGDEPMGWDTQLKNEIVFALAGQRVARHVGGRIGPLEYDAVTHAGLTLGTLRTAISAGGTVRIGTGLDASYAPPRLRPAIGPSSLFRPGAGGGAYVFAGVGAYGVARDVFLDGNTFADSRSVEKYPAVADLQAGAEVRWKTWRAAFTYVLRTEQYRGQDGPQGFGAVSVSRAF
ncbi:MAG: lipid A deacylase LpxR family protein [Oceanicaulis sp.]